MLWGPKVRVRNENIASGPLTAAVGQIFTLEVAGPLLLESDKTGWAIISASRQCTSAGTGMLGETLALGGSEPWDPAKHEAEFIAGTHRKQKYSHSY